MYLIITVVASLLVALVLVYLVHAVFDREPPPPGSTRAGRRAAQTTPTAGRAHREKDS